MRSAKEELLTGHATVVSTNDQRNEGILFAIQTACQSDLSSGAGGRGGAKLPKETFDKPVDGEAGELAEWRRGVCSECDLSSCQKVRIRRFLREAVQFGAGETERDSQQW